MSKLITKKQWQDFCWFMTDCCAILSKDFDFQWKIAFPQIDVQGSQIVLAWCEPGKSLIFYIKEEGRIYCLRVGEPPFNCYEKIDKSDYKKIKEMFAWHYER